MHWRRREFGDDDDTDNGSDVARMDWGKEKINKHAIGLVFWAEFKKKLGQNC